MIVDDRIPCFKESNNPIFGHSFNIDGKSGGSLSVSLIEKAYAKLHGCYESLETGYCDEALEDLTGYFTERI